ncbi:histidine kinase [Streptomyces sp. NPDC004539]|uniref:sensor histidine kinase n=1 Tax=Streptomyces sp. NPDC004539 TaxID=3154280 RepID=UPI0033A5439F
MIEILRQLPGPPGRRRLLDAALSLALFACALPGSQVAFPGKDPELSVWPGLLLAGVACAVLPWRRKRPRATVAVIFVCTTVMSALGYLLSVMMLAPLMVALHTLAVSTDRRTANTFAFTGIAVLTGTELFLGPTGEPLVLKVLSPAAWLLLPTSLGTVTRLRGAWLTAERARAEHAERTREEEARRRVTEERLRIARDLHDVVAHHLVLANLQAGAVARSLRARPEEAAETVVALTDTTASALRELKATVGLLRHSGGVDPGGSADAVPGVAHLPDLAASFRGAGLSVTVDVEGEPRPLPSGADVTAYRIVQEALTNVTKHAATGSARVRLSYLPERLDLSVVNEGASTPRSTPRSSGGVAGGGGYGLVGMRERARAVGGQVRTGHRPRGGFEVVAELPLTPSGS